MTKQYKHILSSLDEASSTLIGETGARASGLYARLAQAETLLCLRIVADPLALLENFNKSLQSRRMTVSGMLGAVDCIKTELLALRNDSTFTKLMDQIKNETNEFKLNPLQLPRKKTTPSRYSDGSAAGHHFETVEDFYRQKYFQFIDTIQVQMEERFSYEDLNTYGFMENSLVTKDVSPATTAILARYPEINCVSLQMELEMFHRHAENAQKDIVYFTDIVQHLKSMTEEVRNLFPAINALAHLLQLSPPSSAEPERTFSSLRRLKTWLRNTVSQNRLNAIAICHVHQDILDLVDVDELVNDFATRSTIRKSLFG